ncbi:TPA: hypothetical protein ACH3X2_001196 [Trebouxia sp. C0005]|nr:MAG: ribosomal S24 S35 [Trebouxia sp. A1-2]
MKSLRGALGYLSDAVVSRLASHAAASCSAAPSSLRESLQYSVIDYLNGARHFASGVDYTKSPPGAIAGDTKVKIEDQPGDSLEAELTRVRAKRLTRAERPQYLGNADFEEELKESSILVEPDIPIYDLREAMKQVGYSVEPRVPLFDTLQKMPLDSPEIQSLRNMAQEEEPPFQGARRILQWEQRIVFSHGSFAGEHPVNRKAKCNVYLRDLQEQAGLTDEAVQLIARVCGSRCNANKGLLTLVSEKYSMREENRRHILEILAQLVSEGHQAFPVPGVQMPGDRLPEKQVA